MHLNYPFILLCGPTQWIQSSIVWHLFGDKETSKSQETVSFTIRLSFYEPSKAHFMTLRTCFVTINLLFKARQKCANWHKKTLSLMLGCPIFFVQCNLHIKRFVFLTRTSFWKLAFLLSCKKLVSRLNIEKKKKNKNKQKKIVNLHAIFTGKKVIFFKLDNQKIKRSQDLHVCSIWKQNCKNKQFKSILSKTCDFLYVHHCKTCYGSKMIHIPHV